MENRGLLFIPDISGFTRFVNEMEIEHSRLIIQELLEILINANQLGLEISEIEGDAILFYKFGDCPNLEEVYKQVERMFCDFHRNLIAYDNRRFCQCKACMTAIELSLKVITHYGEFTGYNVKNFNKLIGRDIIIAHQLLKNDIEQHEYWLVTNSLLHDKAPVDFAKWMKWNSSSKKTESGEITFHYTQLSNLKNEISPEPLLLNELSNKVKMSSVTHDFDTDVITLFHATGDFNYRSQWQEGVKAVEEVSHFLPRVGMRCRCIMKDGQSTVYTTGYSYSPERIVFSEIDENKKSAWYYTLEQIAGNKSRITIDYYLGKNIPRQILFSVVKKNKWKSTMERSMLNLERLVKVIHFAR
jgi:Protein of unknown function (DUF2652).